MKAAPATDGRMPATGALLYDSEARSSHASGHDYSRYAGDPALELCRPHRAAARHRASGRSVNPLNHAAVAAVVGSIPSPPACLLFLAADLGFVTSGSRGAELALPTKPCKVENAERKRAEGRCIVFGRQKFLTL
jgi:hypothetical protein